MAGFQSYGSSFSCNLELEEISLNNPLPLLGLFDKSLPLPTKVGANSVLDTFSWPSASLLLTPMPAPFPVCSSRTSLPSACPDYHVYNLSVWTTLLWLLLAHSGVMEDRLCWLKPLCRAVPPHWALLAFSHIHQTLEREFTRSPVCCLTTY